jgi:hypothetical protein
VGLGVGDRLRDVGRVEVLLAGVAVCGAAVPVGSEQWRWGRSRAEAVPDQIAMDAIANARPQMNRSTCRFSRLESAARAG